MPAADPTGPASPAADSGPAAALAAAVHAALPQTQCTRCGFPDCLGYAQAIATGAAQINQCPPGGHEGIVRLAAVTGRSLLPLNPVHGSEGPRAVAVIDEDWCIGCTLCLDACPTDAILGSNKLMHTVIEPYCTGCELCIPVCPVDCISLENVTGERTGWAAWSQVQADQALGRYRMHTAMRLAGDREPQQATEATTTSPPVEPVPASTDTAGERDGRRRAVIEAALASARARRAPPS